jgi:maltose O-acetyltransferase
MKHKFLLLYSWFVRTILFFFPDIPFIMRFRGFLYGLGMNECGKDFQVPHDAITKGIENIIVGDHVLIGNHSIIMGGGNIVIGNEVLIGPHVVIISGNHSKKNHSYRYGEGKFGKISIGDGAWIAANCTISMNSCLPQGSILSANSFLNKDFGIPNAIYGGVPAKLIKHD